jgi:hypothetical protein
MMAPATALQVRPDHPQIRERRPEQRLPQVLGAGAAADADLPADGALVTRRGAKWANAEVAGERSCGW